MVVILRSEKRTGGLHQPVLLSGLRPSQEREAAAGTDEKSREQGGFCLRGNHKKAEKRAAAP